MRSLLNCLVMGHELRASDRDLSATDFMAKLTSLSACQEAKSWATGKTLRQAWESCENPSWMLWLLGRSTISKKVIATIAVEFAEQPVHYAEAYPAVAECIAVTKRFLAGEATQEELWAAESAAWAAESAARAARVAGAAESAALAARAARAAWAAESAAWAAGAAESSRVAWAAESAAKTEQCNIIRKHVTADRL